MADQLLSLENKYKTLSNSLGSSNTAYNSSSGIPSPKDLSLSKQLSSVNQQIDDLKSKGLRNSWYGPDDAPVEDTGDSGGIFMSGLKASQKLLNAIAGTAQYALGKGTQSSLGANINAATKSGLTFGNILQQEGAPRGVQIPLGFALDVMFDPINWLTMGTAALIPRVGTGLIKGTMKGGIKQGLEAAGTGLVSNLEKKAVKTMSFMPLAKKLTGNTLLAEKEGLKDVAKRGFFTQGAVKYTNLMDKVGQKAITGAEKYDTLIGSNINDRLNKLPWGIETGKIGKFVENQVNKIPSIPIWGKNTPTGKEIVKFFKYSPSTDAEMLRYHDMAFQNAKDKNIILMRGDEGIDFMKVSDMEGPGAKIIVQKQVKRIVDGAFKDADGVLVKAEDVLTGKKDNLYRNVEVPLKNDLGELTEGLRPIRVKKDFENSKYFLDASIDDEALKKFADTFKISEPGKIGFQWADDKVAQLKNLQLGDMVPGTTKTLKQITDEAGELIKTVNSYDNKILDLKPLQKLLDIFPKYLSVFKSFKVPMNPASHTVAIIGNFFMGKMMGLPTQKIEFLNEVRQARQLLGGKLGTQGFLDVFGGDVDSLWDMMENNPHAFRRVTGMDAISIHQRAAMEGKMLKDVKEEVLPFIKVEAEKAYLEYMKQGAQIEKLASRETRLAKEAIMPKYPTGTETSRKLAETGPITSLEQSTSFTGEMSNDMMEILGNRVAKNLADNPQSYTAQIANTVINSMPRWYEQIDQSFKIGTTNFLIRHGLTEGELKIITGTVPIKTEDIIGIEKSLSSGEKLYKLSPTKASEIALEAFMNYSAMPDFVKMTRAIPFGSPFFSFPYAMAIKMGKTALANPAIFNKTGFMINEMNADRSPAEKAAMEEKYNQYLKSPTVVKMFGMWNTDVKNWIPIFQMNMLNPSQRKYGDSNQGKIFAMFDKLPIFQDPVTSVFKDYVIQPWVLSGSGEIPQGSFGQPLYPTFDENGKKIDVGLGTKAFYGARTLTESVVPGVAGYTGLLAGGLSPEMINLIPSYRAKSIAFAETGKSSIGAATKENAMQKTLRSVLGATGIPAYTLDATKTSTKK